MILQIVIVNTLLKKNSEKDLFDTCLMFDVELKTYLTNLLRRINIL
jgi:hypothetical protein